MHYLIMIDTIIRAVEHQSRGICEDFLVHIKTLRIVFLFLKMNNCVFVNSYIGTHKVFTNIKYTN